jgi:arginyl-tRNA synthetase
MAPVRALPTPDPVARLAGAISEIAGAQVTLERPGDADHGDFASNVALQLAGLV